MRVQSHVCLRSLAMVPRTAQSATNRQAIDARSKPVVESAHTKNSHRLANVHRRSFGPIQQVGGTQPAFGSRRAREGRDDDSKAMLLGHEGAGWSHVSRASEFCAVAATKNCAVMATRTARWRPPDLSSSCGQGRYPLPADGLRESDAVACGGAEVGVVEEPVNGGTGEGFGHDLVEAALRYERPTERWGGGSS